MNSGSYLGVANLFTPHFRESYMGTANPYDVPRILAGMTMSDVTVGDIRTHADGRISAEASYLANGHQVVRERSFFVEEDGYLKVDELQPLPPAIPADAVTVRIVMREYAFDLDATSVPSGAPVVLSATNAGQEPHEIILVQLPTGATAADVLAGTVTQDQVRLIAQGGAPPGGSFDMVLVDLEPGTYTLLDFIPAPDGLPHLVHGMSAQLTVT